MKNKKQKAFTLTTQYRLVCGFTLIEVLLVVVLVGMLAGVGIPIYQALQSRNDLDIASSAVAQNLRRAQILAQAVDGDSAWGTRIQTGGVVVFKGSSFASRDQDYDETFEISSSIVSSGLSEVVFSKLAGFPQTTGTVTLISQASEKKNITINSKGTVSY
ncbi:MAG: hypothetical protein A2751_05470 [Candidatus Doudnabacteria bacterium RIFCSPHIGHO2_01_FULL_46_14]|uniref:General secretion pathway GspH domain-containing protein n=1 Tax=Candidatus Doudnabacteria bacterium RIFCSPHIGHO2_01_FULL_46_14 TaxID=1817824 RepID=A0A1F5NPA8_9BACT|nr:MAG: hypothetical protein A2751_05470 [Candidatus Doudnabacteria bacterium RIFCSPHIGHO2_01_FULL_46_14]